MKKYRKHSLEFKQRVLQELLSGTTSLAQLCRRYNITHGLIYSWKEKHEQGVLTVKNNQTALLKEQVCELERIVGKLTMENEFLKKALQNSLEQLEVEESLFAEINPKFGVSKGGANS